ncbi:type II secretion system secretin GspD [Erwinia tracheiphila]|uniref:type II secretion system secretin GspD n=2 Tax=Erwinia tracheiphila TaxID=65700 RepID=UPI0003A1CEF7|nr:type II secretion system secretin GspD [Erwinia tracheiphila]UIA87921.1 type II secretion system secretin GspD [Erwinia tracheiphila]UIA96504.1 type II secretion system secretin GspD [Erwinia tracheiphila]
MDNIISSKNRGLLSVVFYSCFLFTHFACNEAAAASMEIGPSPDNTANSVVTPRFTAAFKNTDIREFINIVSKNLHKTIIIDSHVQGEVSVHSYEQLTADQYYQFFLNVLEVYGYTVITNSDNILKVVPSEKGERAALTAQKKKLNGAEIVVRIVPMQNLSGDSLAPILDKFNNNMGVGSVRYYKPGNSLLITGRADEVRTLEAIVLDLDKNSSNRTSVDIIPVRNTKPSVIKKAVTDIYSSSDDSSADSEFSRPKLVAEDQAKVLLVNGTDKARQTVRSIIARLDKVANAKDNSKVIFLKYTDAVDMAKLLSSYGGTNNDSDHNVQNAGDVGTGTGSSDGEHAQNDSSSNFGEQNQFLSNNSTQFSSDYGSSLNSGSPIFEGASVHADKANNALVVHAPEEEMREIESIINKLDIRRNQVLVEAIIVEIQDADGLNLGVSWANALGGGFGYNSDGDSNRVTRAANGFGENQPIASALKESGGLVAGFYHGNWGFLFSALESNKHNNILATPSIVTLDNRQAEFNVGQDIPILTGSQTTNSDNIFNTVERRTVGFKFKIRSMIDQGNTVQLYISQEISSLTDANTANIDSKLGAVFNIRTVNNVVQVENGETVVIGGLLDKEQNNRVSKVPLLGDIPWIGGLFRYTSHNDTKRNLMLFIRPHIIRVQDRYNDFTASQYASFKEDQQKDNPELVKSLEPHLSGRSASSRESIAHIQSNIAEFAREVAE